MPYLIVPDDCVEMLCDELRALGGRPWPRYSEDHTEAIVTEPDDASHEGALTDAELADVLASAPTHWGVPAATGTIFPEAPG